MICTVKDQDFFSLKDMNRNRLTQSQRKYLRKKICAKPYCLQEPISHGLCRCRGAIHSPPSTQGRKIYQLTDREYKLALKW